MALLTRRKAENWEEFECLNFSKMSGYEFIGEKMEVGGSLGVAI